MLLYRVYTYNFNYFLIILIIWKYSIPNYFKWLFNYLFFEFTAYVLYCEMYHYLNMQLSTSYSRGEALLILARMIQVSNPITIKHLTLKNTTLT